MAKQFQTPKIWRHSVTWLAQPSENLHPNQISLILSEVSCENFVGWATWATQFSPFLRCSRFRYRDSRASAFALGFFLGICSWSCKQRWQWLRAIGKSARRQAWWLRRMGTDWLFPLFISVPHCNQPVFRSRCEHISQHQKPCDFCAGTLWWQRWDRVDVLWGIPKVTTPEPMDKHEINLK